MQRTKYCSECNMNLTEFGRMCQRVALHTFMEEMKSTFPAPDNANFDKCNWLQNLVEQQELQGMCSQLPVEQFQKCNYLCKWIFRVFTVWLKIQVNLLLTVKVFHFFIVLPRNNFVPLLLCCSNVFVDLCNEIFNPHSVNQCIKHGTSMHCWFNVLSWNTNHGICHCLLFHEHDKQNFVQSFLQSRKLLRLHTRLE